MPDSAGEGFPLGCQVGHEHLQLSTGKIYQYLGGTPGLSSSWRVARGINAVCQAYTNATIVPANTNPLLITYAGVSSLLNIGWDGLGTFTIQVPGYYILTHHGQLEATGLAAGQQRRVTIWFKRNGIDLAESPVTNSISGNVSDMRIIRNYRVQYFDAGDVLNTYVVVEEAGLGIGLYAETLGGVTSQSAKLSLSWIPT